MTNNIIKNAVKIGAIAGGVWTTAELFGSFGKGHMLGQLMRAGDPYAVETHRQLSSLKTHGPRQRFVKWFITDVADWITKQKG